jgi:hypothetical protein
MSQTKVQLVDLNGLEAIIDADADTSITADTDDQIDFKIGGNDTIVINAQGSTPLMQINAGASNNNLYIASTDATSGISLSDNGGSINLATTSSGAFRVMTGGDASSAADNSAISMLIDANGHVTMPLQTALQVRPASTQSNVSDGDTVVFGTERFDINGDFASNTFTAPVDGKYLVNFVTRTQQLDTASSHVRYRFNTSNFTYEIIKSPDVYTADQTFSLWNFNLLCDFDANDTMTVTIDFSGGADQIDIDDQTFLSINLAC